MSMSHVEYLMLAFLIDVALALSVSMLIGGIIHASSQPQAIFAAAMLIGFGALSLMVAFGLMAYLIVRVSENETTLNSLCKSCTIMVDGKTHGGSK